MIAFKKYILVSIFAIALIASAGAAFAKPVMWADGLTVKVDTIQTNGVYQGFPVWNTTGDGRVTYDYRIVPDGTYTVFGTIDNKNEDRSYEVTVTAEPFNSELESMVFSGYSTTVIVPASSDAPFSLSLPAPSDRNIRIYATADRLSFVVHTDVSSIDYVMAADSMTHTVNMGPMSDTVAIFTNGKLVYNGLPQYSVSLY